MLTDLTNILAGWRTYLTGAAAIVYGGGNWTETWATMSPDTAAILTFFGFGLVFLRKAINTVGLDLTRKV